MPLRISQKYPLSIMKFSDNATIWSVKVESQSNISNENISFTRNICIKTAIFWFVRRKIVLQRSTEIIIERKRAMQLRANIWSKQKDVCLPFYYNFFFCFFLFVYSCLTNWEMRVYEVLLKISTERAI